MGKVIILEEANNKMNNLVLILYNKGYFGFMDSALSYVKALHDFILSIPSQRHYRTAKSKYGHFYSRYQPNKNTTYYITFDIIEDYYFVQNVITNHTRDYPLYIMGT